MASRRWNLPLADKHRQLCRRSCPKQTKPASDWITRAEELNPRRPSVVLPITRFHTSAVEKWMIPGQRLISSRLRINSELKRPLLARPNNQANHSRQYWRKKSAQAGGSAGVECAAVFSCHGRFFWQIIKKKKLVPPGPSRTVVLPYSLALEVWHFMYGAVGANLWQERPFNQHGGHVRGGAWAWFWGEADWSASHLG